MSRQPRMSWLSPKVRTGETAAHGRGVVARVPIAKGETIAVLGGHILTLAELFLLPPEAQDTAFQVDDDLVCTYATVEELRVYGSDSGDCFNHSCNPNAGFRGQIEIIAMKDIEPGEQVTFDYALCLTTHFADMQCLCSRLNCRGKVTGDDWKLPELQRRYRGYFQPYIERKIDQIWSRDFVLVEEEVA